MAGEKQLGVGLYVRPVDATDDPDHTHKLEGTVWAVERLPEETTGELVDWAHVVRVWHGDLAFNMLPASRVGSVSPTHPSTVDGLIKIAARALQKQGRRSDRRLFALVHACGFMVGLPQFVDDIPSIFGDVPEPTVADVVKPAASVDTDEQVARLIARLEQLDNTAVNEIRRDARSRQLGYLEPGASLPLGDLVSYDALLARWERQAARQQAAAS
jgi:hypothetical protein